MLEHEAQQLTCDKGVHARDGVPARVQPGLHSAAHRRGVQRRYGPYECLRGATGVEDLAGPDST